MEEEFLQFTAEADPSREQHQQQRHPPASKDPTERTSTETWNEMRKTDSMVLKPRYSDVVIRVELQVVPCRRTSPPTAMLKAATRTFRFLVPTMNEELIYRHEKPDTRYAPLEQVPCTEFGREIHERLLPLTSV